MSLKTPLPDNVFKEWLRTKDNKKIEKTFGRKPADISPMEVVGKEIQKSPALIFKSKVNQGQVKSKNNDDLYDYRQLEKEKFYKFNKKVKRDEWKGDMNIVLLKDIQETKCNECSGNGIAKPCKNCNGKGVSECDKCRKEKDLHCNNCKGKGQIEINMEVYDEEGKKDKVKKMINCYECHGKAIKVCENCGGTKKVACKKCKGEGGQGCKKCRGTGVLYKLPYSTVPMEGGEQINVYWNSDIEKQMSKSKTMKNNELIDLLAQKNVQPIKISNYKDLDSKKLEEELGFWDKDASRQVNDCKNDFQKKMKDGSEEPKYPIEIYPLQKIDIDTYENKKFSIYSIGSQNGYIVFDLGF